MHVFFRRVLTLLVLLLAVATARAATEEQEIAAYKLDMATVRAVFAASTTIARLEQEGELEEDESEHEDEGEDEDGLSIAQLAARIESSAQARSAVAAAGLEPREFALATIALMHASMAVAMLGENDPLPPGINPDNVALIRANRAEIDRLSAASRGGD